MLTKTTAGKDRLLTGMSELRRQWFVLRLAMIAIYTPVALALLIVVIVRIRTGIAIADFTVDPLIVVGGAPVYTGILSTIGGLIWAGTVAICFFSWNPVRTRPQSAPQASFLLAAAIVTLILLIVFGLWRSGFRGPRWGGPWGPGGDRGERWLDEWHARQHQEMEQRAPSTSTDPT